MAARSPDPQAPGTSGHFCARIIASKTGQKNSCQVSSVDPDQLVTGEFSPDIIPEMKTYIERLLGVGSPLIGAGQNQRKFIAYINYIRDGRVHAGVYVDNSVIYVREAEPGTSNQLKGYLELRLNEDTPRDWASVNSILRDAYAKIGRPSENTIHHIDTEFGSFELLYRAGLPSTPELAAIEFQKYFARIEAEGKEYRFSDARP